MLRHCADFGWGAAELQEAGNRTGAELFLFDGLDTGAFDRLAVQERFKCFVRVHQGLLDLTFDLASLDGRASEARRLRSSI